MPGSAEDAPSSGLYNSGEIRSPTSGGGGERACFRPHGSAPRNRQRRTPVSRRPVRSADRIRPRFPAFRHTRGSTALPPVSAWSCDPVCSTGANFGDISPGRKSAEEMEVIINLSWIELLILLLAVVLIFFLILRRRRGVGGETRHPSGERQANSRGRSTLMQGFTPRKRRSAPVTALTSCFGSTPSASTDSVRSPISG